MATISSAGIGSGLDVSSIVTQLVAIERQPIDALNTEKTALQQKLSSFGLIQSYAVNIQDAAAALAKPTLWQSTTAKSGDETKVSATSSTSAVPGSYSVEVSTLAQSQATVSKSYASSTDSVGTGTLRIELGSYTNGGMPFIPQTPPQQVDIPINVGESSLESVRTKINNSNAGVTASIVRDSAGAKLVLRSNATGIENSMRISAVPADPPSTPGGSTLNDLAFSDPSSTTSTMKQSMEPKNASGFVNGVAFTSASNKLTGAIEGVTLTLNAPTTSATQVTVGVDSGAMKTALTNFAKAYSDFNKYVADQTKYDPDSKTAAPLQGDRATLTLQSQMRSMIGATSTASSVFGRLSDAGLEIQADGSLKLNESKFDDAVAKLPELSKAFTASGNSSSSANGFAVRIQALTEQMTATDGTVTTRSDGLRASITRNEKQVADMEDRVARTKARIEAQYSALDTTMAKLTGLNTYITQQITNWNK